MANTVQQNVYSVLVTIQRPALCTRPVLVHYDIVVNPCRDQSELLVSEPYGVGRRARLSRE